MTRRFDFSNKWVRFIVPLVWVLFSADAAHAQRIPDVYIWFAGASLLAPFVAVPIKMVILRLLALEVPSSRLWSLSAMEWVLWFPIAFLLLRTQGLYSLPIAVALLFGASTWLHQARVANTTWKSALLLSLSTPILALALPILAFSATAFVESLD